MLMLMLMMLMMLLLGRCPNIEMQICQPAPSLPPALHCWSINVFLMILNMMVGYHDDYGGGNDEFCGDGDDSGVGLFKSYIGGDIYVITQ